METAVESTPTLNIWNATQPIVSTPPEHFAASFESDLALSIVGKHRRANDGHTRSRNTHTSCENMILLLPAGLFLSGQRTFSSPILHVVSPFAPNDIVVAASALHSFRGCAMIHGRGVVS